MKKIGLDVATSELESQFRICWASVQTAAKVTAA